MLSTVLGFVGGRRLIPVLVAVLAVASAIGWHYLTVRRLERENAELERVVSEMRIERERREAEIEKLVAVNRRMEAELRAQKRLTEELQRAWNETAKALEESRRSLDELARNLDSDRNRRRLEAIRRSRKAELLLRILNRQVACVRENFLRTDGRCVAGRFVPNDSDG